MKPGTTSPPPASMRWVLAPTSRATSALSPTARTVSPRTATAAAQGRAVSPVQTRPKTTRSATGARAQPASSGTRGSRASRASGPGRRMGKGAGELGARELGDAVAGSRPEPGQPAEGFELLDGTRPLGGSRGRHGEEIPDVEQDLQHQLVAHVGVVEVGHAALLPGRPGALVGLLVDDFEVGDDLVARAHGRGS